MVQPAETVDYSGIGIVQGLLLEQRLLQLQADLDHLNRRGQRFGDSRRNAAQQELDCELLERRPLGLAQHSQLNYNWQAEGIPLVQKINILFLDDGN